MALVEELSIVVTVIDPNKRNKSFIFEGNSGARRIQAPLQWRELNIDVNLVKVPKSIGKLKHIEKFAPHWNNLRCSQI